MSTDAPTDLWPARTELPPRDPYRAVFSSFIGTGERDLTAPGAPWPSTVTVDVVEGFDPDGELADPRDVGYADVGQVVQLVELDTNYKDTRASEYPVQLTRVDAIRFVAAVLRAVEGTFDASRVGCLRRAEGIEVLDALGELDGVLAQVRVHAVGDIACDIDEIWQRTPEQLHHPGPVLGPATAGDAP